MCVCVWAWVGKLRMSQRRREEGSGLCGVIHGYEFGISYALMREREVGGKQALLYGAGWRASRKQCPCYVLLSFLHLGALSAWEDIRVLGGCFWIFIASNGSPSRRDNGYMLFYCQHSIEYKVSSA